MQHNPSFKRLTSVVAVSILGLLILISLFSGKRAVSSSPVLRTQPGASLIGSTAQRPLPAAPEILAHSYLVQVVGDVVPLLEGRKGKQMHPASLTKVLTSIVAMEELDENTPVVFSSFAKATGEKESPVPAGETFLRNDVIRFAMIESANDAAAALAEAVGRKRGAFSFDDALLIFNQVAGQKARTLGMMNSQFQNPTGLDNEDHYTTAEDLFHLVSYVWDRHPEIWEFSRSFDADIRSITNEKYHIEATNQLLSEFPALRGGKTGFTDEAKGCLILLYPVKPDRTAAIIILGSEDRFDDGRKLINWLDQAF